MITWLSGFKAKNDRRTTNLINIFIFLFIIYAVSHCILFKQIELFTFISSFGSKWNFPFYLRKSFYLEKILESKLYSVLRSLHFTCVYVCLCIVVYSIYTCTNMFVSMHTCIHTETRGRCWEFCFIILVSLQLLLWAKVCILHVCKHINKPLHHVFTATYEYSHIHLYSSTHAGLCTPDW